MSSINTYIAFEVFSEEYCPEIMVEYDYSPAGDGIFGVEEADIISAVIIGGTFPDTMEIGQDIEFKMTDNDIDRITVEILEHEAADREEND